MSLVMTGEDFYEAYGPNGPDEDDLRVLRETAERLCEHDDAITAAEATGRDLIYCPCCGVQVYVPGLIEAMMADAEAAAERRIGC